MITLEFKLKGKAQQYRVIDEMIRTAQFVRNKTLKYWTENQGVKLIEMYKQCAVMASLFEWAGKLNSMARQASAERAIFAIQRFFANCQAKKPGKKGYPQFKKHTRSVEYKTSGWSLSNDKRCLTLKRLQKQISRKKKGYSNRKKAINKLGRKHLKVSRQRQDFAIKTALYAVKSSDFVAHEDLQVKNMVKNHKLAKSISDAAWSQFAQWLEYFGKVYDKTVIAVAPQYTSQDCSNCGNTILKTLSTRTHICGCGTILDRDHNAAKNILAKGLKARAGITLNTAGHAEINAWGQTDLYSLVVTSMSKLTE